MNSYLSESPLSNNILFRTPSRNVSEIPSRANSGIQDPFAPRLSESEDGGFEDPTLLATNLGSLFDQAGMEIPYFVGTYKEIDVPNSPEMPTPFNEECYCCFNTIPEDNSIDVVVYNCGHQVCRSPCWNNTWNSVQNSPGQILRCGFCRQEIKGVHYKNSNTYKLIQSA